MSRSYSIHSFIPSGGVGSPGKIAIIRDNGVSEDTFSGSFYRTTSGECIPAFNQQPIGSVKIQATTFLVTQNNKYSGRYQVYTPTDAEDTIKNPSCMVEGNKLIISVSQIIADPTDKDDLVGGQLSEISTYTISVIGEPSIVLPPNTTNERASIGLFGSGGTGWGEMMNQNFMTLAQNFAGENPPAPPVIGQQWFDTKNAQMNIHLGDGWRPVPTVFKFTKATPATSWTIRHNTNIPAPFICGVQVFYEAEKGQFKPIIPQDITFISGNHLKVTFSTPRSGMALLYI